MWDKDIVQRAAGQICQYKCTKLPINASSSGRSIALRASQKRRDPASLSFRIPLRVAQGNARQDSQNFTNHRLEHLPIS